MGELNSARISVCLRQEFGENSLDIGLRTEARHDGSVHCFRHTFACKNGTDLIFLQHAHILARFRRRNGDSVLFKYALQSGYRSEAAEIDGGAGPIQNHRLHAILNFISVSNPLFQRSVSKPPAATAHTTKKVKS